MAKKKPSYQSSKLTAEQEALLRQEKELRQREELLRRRLQQLPAVMAKRRRHRGERYPKTIHATFGEGSRIPATRKNKERHLRVSSSRREKKAAKIKFIVLIVILTSLLILIWRSLPA